MVRSGCPVDTSGAFAAFARADLLVPVFVFQLYRGQYWGVRLFLKGAPLKEAPLQGPVTEAPLQGPLKGAPLQGPLKGAPLQGSYQVLGDGGWTIPVSYTHLTLPTIA